MENFKFTGTVRDYELDIHKIVNNAVYMNYLEHARHLALETLSPNLNFVQLHEKGIDLVLVNSEINFKSPLKSGDKFEISTNFQMSGKVRIICHQLIKKSDIICIKSNSIITSITNSNSNKKPGIIHFPNFVKNIFK